MKIETLLIQMLVVLFSVIKGLISVKLLVLMGGGVYAFTSQFMVVSLFISQAILINYNAIAVIDVSKGIDPSIVYKGMLFILFSVSTIVGIVFFFADSYLNDFFWNSEGYRYGLSLLFIHLFLSAFTMRNLAYLQAKKQFKKYGLVQILQSVFQISSLLLGWYFNNVYIVIVLYIFVEFLILLGCRYFIRCEISDKIQLYIIYDWVFSNYKKALGLFLASLILWLFYNYGRFIITNSEGLEGLSKYAASLSIILLSGLLVNNVTSIYLPYISGGDVGEVYLYRKQAYLVLNAVTCFPALFIYIFSPYLIEIVASKDFFLGRDFFIPFLLAITVLAQIRLMSLICISAGREIVSWFGYFIGCAVSVFYSFLFVSKYGVIHIPIGMLLGSVISYIYFAIILRYISGVFLLTTLINASFIFVVNDVIDAEGVPFSLISYAFIFFVNFSVLFSQKTFRDLILRRLS